MHLNIRSLFHTHLLLICQLINCITYNLTDNANNFQFFQLPSHLSRHFLSRAVQYELTINVRGDENV